MVTSYAPLLLRSNYSLLNGVASIDDILQIAIGAGMKSIALTDTNNLYAAIPFYKKAKKTGIKPIIGVELIPDNFSQIKRNERIILLAQNLKGYSNICRIISRVMLKRNETTGNYNTRNSLNILDYIDNSYDGIYFISENPATAEELSKFVNKKFIKLLIIRPDHSLKKQDSIFTASIKLGLDLVGSTNTHFLYKQDFDFYKLLTAIKENILIDENNTNLQEVTANNYFYSPQSANNLFADCQELLINSAEVIEDCNLEIPLKKYVFPKYHVPDKKEPSSYLYGLCLQGLDWRYENITKVITARLKHELDVIERLGFSEYFLVVGDIVRFARSENIPVVGRGSGASSIVTYSLGITNVDPIKHNLCFERFMNNLRHDFPDLDIDLCWRKRDAVINYVYQTYGADHVAMISTHNCFQPRSAFREVAKTYGMANNEVNSLSKLIPHNTENLELLSKKIIPFKTEAAKNRSFNTILRMADRLTGTPHHTGIHSGGIVITDKPIESYVPLEIATKGIVVTQYDMRAIEDIGLIKLDLLGNRALSTLRETVNTIEKERSVKVVLDKIPDKDPDAVKLLKNGLTLGCFQIESPGMRNLLKMLKVSSVDETIASLSLIRPGPASGGLKESYVRRSQGLEPVKYVHPLLESVLKDSYGIMLYEEDAIRSASVVAGISLARGDKFRRSIAKAKTRKELNFILRTFIDLANKNGVHKDAAATICNYISNFASYTFCRAHAAGYGYLAYQGAYLKAHFPVEFIVALLNNHQGMYGQHVHIEEARRMQVDILSPCVNRSEIEYRVENGSIRVALQQVKGLSIKIMEQIVSKRPFTSLTDFLNLIRISKKEAHSLIKSGAFDFTNFSRPELMWEFETTFVTLNNRPKDNSTLSLDFNITPMPTLKEYSYEKKYWDEYDALEIFINCHPMKLFKQNQIAPNLTDSKNIEKKIGKLVTISGILAARRGAETKRKEKMMFITLEDEKGLFEVTLFPSVYRKYRYLFKDYGPYLVKGRVEDQYGAITITAEVIKRYSNNSVSNH